MCSAEPVQLITVKSTVCAVVRIANDNADISLLNSFRRLVLERFCFINLIVLDSAASASSVYLFREFTFTHIQPNTHFPADARFAYGLLSDGATTYIGSARVRHTHVRLFQRERLEIEKREK